MRFLLTFFVLMMCAGQLRANDSLVYESVSEIHIGRVFLSPGERRALDQKRLQPASAAGNTPASQSTDAATETGAGTNKRAPASGYFVIGSGRPKRWQEGDFVGTKPGTDIENLRFPGDVRVVRHPVKSGPAESSDEAATKPVGVKREE